MNSTNTDGGPNLREFHSALSALQLGSLFTWGLHGILSVQVYNYYLSFPNDPITRKLLVYSIWILETLHVGLATRDIYDLFINGFGSFQAVDKFHLIPLTIPIMGGIIGLICHLIFSYRIFRITRSWLIAGSIAILALCSASAAITFGAKMFEAKSLSKVLNSIPGLSSLDYACGLWNGLGAACDIIIAITLTCFLSKAPTGFRRTDLLVDRIIRLTIETGTVTATASVASVVLFVGFRKQIETVGIYFVVPAISIAKLYSITIMATFNNRPNAVGGPPPIADEEYRFDTVTGKSTLDPREIRIGRTVVRQVWPDGIPMSHIEIKTRPESLTGQNNDTDTDTVPMERDEGNA
ncbi:hypothetical protein HYPSUDRAFT_916655 [Hypholoma sublateritium FD-334 SS-4]|uniref:DUF6534 domain-containing protein n=1 Tax=Hypholoma sublateritium (strain FD-334 SS-4) TaxID=945553 RepID=A0A0D2M6H5_HYPSF|nr:hypothetical protein HYPSUDRAFT_916655 [Hypholoma sublateritium FD-334 SS-4]